MTTAKEKEEAAADKKEAADKKAEDAATKQAEKARQEAGAKLLEPFEASTVKIEPELLQGDSLRINVTRGNLTVHIPLPVEGTNNVNTLNNAFKLVKDVLEVKNEKELREKFGSLVD